MDWLRRNWPDLLIGLALIAVIAGIVATLLTGGSFFPLGGGSTPASTPSPPSVSAPADDLDDASDADADAAPGGDDDGPSVAVLPPSDSSDDPPGAPDRSVDEAGPDEAASDVDEDAGASSVLPVAPDDEGQAPDLSEADAATQADAASDEPSTEAAASDADASDANASDAASADLPTEPYRVSVGAFGLRENADAQADRFRDAGYPVFVAAQDALALVLVGPYDDEAEARAVADEIRAGDFGIEPVIYEFRPDEDGADAPGGTPSPVQESAEPASPDASEPEPDEASEPSATTSAPQPGASGTRLQVGAYADTASAEPQIERLASLGFEPDTLEEDGLVKLVVGPFDGAALSDARVVLEGADIPHFAR